MKSLYKKIGVVALSGLMVVGGALGSKSVAHADEPLIKHYLEVEKKYVEVNINDFHNVAARHFRLYVVSGDYKEEEGGKQYFENVFKKGKYNGKIQNLPIDIQSSLDIYKFFNDLSFYGIGEGLYKIRFKDRVILLYAPDDIQYGIQWKGIE